MKGKFFLKVIISFNAILSIPIIGVCADEKLAEVPELESGILMGRVQTNDKTPLQGWKVWVIPSNKSMEAASTGKSDENGNFIVNLETPLQENATYAVHLNKPSLHGRYDNAIVGQSSVSFTRNAPVKVMNFEVPPRISFKVLLQKDQQDINGTVFLDGTEHGHTNDELIARIGYYDIGAKAETDKCVAKEKKDFYLAPPPEIVSVVIPCE